MKHDDMAAPTPIFRIAFVAPITAQAITGPRNSVTKLAYAINQQDGAKATVFSTRASETFTFNGCDVAPIAAATWGDVDCVVMSGVWMPEYIKLAKTLRRAGVPYVISPRSSLMRSQFKHSIYKKLPFLILGGYQLLQRATAIHFLTTDEMQQSVFSNKGMVSSNMLDRASLQKAATLMGSETHLPLTKTFGFLGRYTIDHKGLDHLLSAVALVAEKMRASGWVLRLRGSDNRNEKHRLAAMISTFRLGDIVELGDAVNGDEKSEFLAGVDVFIHTSRYEGQPQAVMEAMAHGCAILVTPGANMSQAVRAGSIGYLAEQKPEAIAAALGACMNEPESLESCRRNALHYANAQYNDAAVAEDFITQLRATLG